MMAAHKAMVEKLFENRFTPNWLDEAEAKRAFEAHNAAVRAGPVGALRADGGPNTAALMRLPRDG
jgi:hypothetical protein